MNKEKRTMKSNKKATGSTTKDDPAINVDKSIEVGIDEVNPYMIVERDGHLLSQNEIYQETECICTGCNYLNSKVGRCSGIPPSWWPEFKAAYYRQQREWEAQRRPEGPFALSPQAAKA